MVTSAAVVTGTVPASPPPVIVPTSPSSAIAGPIGTLPVDSPAPIVVSPTAGSQAGPPSGSITSASSGHRHHKKAAHHAVDATLAGWTGHRSRPHVSSRVRAVMHGQDHVS